MKTKFQKRFLIIYKKNLLKLLYLNFNFIKMKNWIYWDIYQKLKNNIIKKKFLKNIFFSNI